MTTYLTNDTDLTTVADAIRTKGGTSAALSFPDGFAEAIEDIPSGRDPNEDYTLASEIHYRSATLPENFVLRAPNFNFDGGWQGIQLFNQYGSYTYECFGAKTIDVYFTTAKVTNITSLLGRSGNIGTALCRILERLSLHFGTQNCTEVNIAQDSFFAIKTLEAGENLEGFDFSSVTTTTISYHLFPALLYIKIVANTTTHNFNISASSLLTDDSIISIANGLNETVSNQTLTLHATPKARCSTLMGTVALDQTSTYHVFTADEAGTVTLADFITNTKGWTLA